MFDTCSEKELEAAIEAMLFVSEEPVSLLSLADVLQCEPSRVKSACSELQQRFVMEDRGIQLSETAGGFRLVTHPRYHELIERYVVSWDTRKLTQAALETLAIVAYCQPITRNGIASVRGVNSDSSVNSLMEKGYLREVGVQDAPGNPVLYGTTKAFLDRFGLNSVSDLPDLEDFAPDEETRTFIAERLNVTSSEACLEVPSELSDNEEESPALSETMQGAMQAMLDEALAQASGAVEKIDFDTLVFEED